MAAELLEVRGVEVKRRGVVVTWLLYLVTLGIYGLFHWFYINREMRDMSAALGKPFDNNPVMSVLALFPGGFLVVPAIWTWVTTARRTRDLREMALDGRAGDHTSYRMWQPLEGLDDLGDGGALGAPEHGDQLRLLAVLADGALLPRLRLDDRSSLSRLGRLAFA